MKVSNFIKDSIKVIDSACQADLSIPDDDYLDAECGLDTAM